MQKKPDKIQHHFVIKILIKLGIEDMYLNVIKTIYDQPITEIVLNGIMLFKNFPSKIQNKTIVQIAPILSNIVIEILARKISKKRK